ncbi:MAG: MBL fold metallo-hydrolase, partial [Muribaculaceae bacterium]|nr:MBL fold metallo-hydrolase [Muribaculaceae bacterium]
MSKKIYFDHPELPFEEWANPYGSASEQEPQVHVPKPLYFCSFGSGSSGNSCYVGSSEGGLIVDVGIRAEELERGLAANGVQMKHVKGVLLTHDHSDHVKYVYALLRSHRHLKLFCTNRV